MDYYQSRWLARISSEEIGPTTIRPPTDWPTTNKNMALRKRKRVTEEEIQQMLLKGDEFMGAEHQEALRRSLTYELEAIGGQMKDDLGRAVASTDEMPVVRVSDEYNSLLVYNKLYGQTADFPVKNTQQREELPMVSAFQPRLHKERLANDWYSFQDLYGGVIDCGPESDEMDAEHQFAMRPAYVCSLTRQIIETAGGEWGWRSLMYINKGPDDPFPTGVVALEAWLFKLKKTIETTKKGNVRERVEGVDEDDLDEIARRITGIYRRIERVVAVRAAGQSDGLDVGASTDFCDPRPEPPLTDEQQRRADAQLLSTEQVAAYIESDSADFPPLQTSGGVTPKQFSDTIEETGQWPPLKVDSAYAHDEMD